MPDAEPTTPATPLSRHVADARLDTSKVSLPATPIGRPASLGRPATRDDVALRAGVSVATVSYVLNDGPRGVSAEKRERVLAAVTALGYRPNALARSLRLRQTQILGLVLPDSANPYFAALSHAIEEVAAARGYQVVVCNAAERPDREAAQIEALLRLQVDGLLWIPADVRPTASRVSRTAIGERRAGPTDLAAVPTVLVDRALPRGYLVQACGTVIADHRRGGQLATEHLVQLGHRRIACLAGPAGHLHAQARLAGYRAALAAAGLAVAGELVAHGRFDYASGDELATRWCRLPAERRPTAIVCGNDAMAIGALSAIARLGLRVPEDVSVTGYDDIPQAAYTVPPLSTVAQPLQAVAAAAVSCLLQHVETRPEKGNDEKGTEKEKQHVAAGGHVASLPARRLGAVVLPVRFVTRHSTAPPPLLP